MNEVDCKAEPPPLKGRSVSRTGVSVALLPLISALGS